MSRTKRKKGKKQKNERTQRRDFLHEHMSRMLESYAWLSRGNGYSHVAAIQSTLTQIPLIHFYCPNSLLKDRVAELKPCIYWHSACKGVTPLLPPAQHISQKISSTVNFCMTGMCQAPVPVHLKKQRLGRIKNQKEKNRK